MQNYTHKKVYLNMNLMASALCHINYMHYNRVIVGQRFVLNELGLLQWEKETDASSSVAGAGVESTIDAPRTM